MSPVADFTQDIALMETALAEERWRVAESHALSILARETGLALKHPDTFAAAREALGLIYIRGGRVSDAARQFSLAIRHKPTARGYAGLCRSTWQKGDPFAQLALIEEALKLEPNNPLYRVTRGELLLTVGGWTRGLADTEYRLAYRPFDVVSETPQVELWDGDDLRGRSIFIAREGGHGDAFMFARYLPQLRARGAGRVIWHTWPTVAALLRGRIPGVDAIVPLSVRGDAWLPQTSLLHRFGTTPETIPPPFPFIEAGERAWPPQRIGLVWSGGPNTTSDRIRSIGLEEISRLVLARSDLSWIALQFPVPAIRPPWTLEHLEWPELSGDWDETVSYTHLTLPTICSV